MSDFRKQIIALYEKNINEPKVSEVVVFKAIKFYESNPVTLNIKNNKKEYIYSVIKLIQDNSMDFSSKNDDLCISLSVSDKKHQEFLSALVEATIKDHKKDLWEEQKKFFGIDEEVRALNEKISEIEKSIISKFKK